LPVPSANIAAAIAAENEPLPLPLPPSPVPPYRTAAAATGASTGTGGVKTSADVAQETKSPRRVKSDAAGSADNHNTTKDRGPRVTYGHGGAPMSTESPKQAHKSSDKPVKGVSAPHAVTLPAPEPVPVPIPTQTVAGSQRHTLHHVDSNATAATVAMAPPPPPPPLPLADVSAALPPPSATFMRGMSLRSSGSGSSTVSAGGGFFSLQNGSSQHQQQLQQQQQPPPSPGNGARASKHSANGKDVAVSAAESPGRAASKMMSSSDRDYNKGDSKFVDDLELRGMRMRSGEDNSNNVSGGSPVKRDNAARGSSSQRDLATSEHVAEFKAELNKTGDSFDASKSKQQRKRMKGATSTAPGASLK
jgi:hypothetical protein